MKLTRSGPNSEVTAPISMKMPVVLAKAEGRKKTSVAGVREIGEVSESTGKFNPRGAPFPSLRSISRLLSCQYTSHVTELKLVTRETILAVDIGATTIKFGVVDSDGQLIEDVLRLPTPTPALRPT